MTKRHKSNKQQEVETKQEKTTKRASRPRKNSKTVHQNKEFTNVVELHREVAKHLDKFYPSAKWTTRPQATIWGSLITERMRKIGVKPGLFSIEIFNGQGGYWGLELQINDPKSQNGRLLDSTQEKWKNAMNSTLNRYTVVSNNYNEIVQKLKWYFSLKGTGKNVPTPKNSSSTLTSQRTSSRSGTPMYTSPYTPNYIHDERSLHQMVAYHLTRFYPQAHWSTRPQGSPMSKCTGAKMKSLGVRAGLGDIQLFNGHGGYWGFDIELKHPVSGGKLSDLQIAWKYIMEKELNRYVLVSNSFDIIAERLKWYFNLPPTSVQAPLAVYEDETTRIQRILETKRQHQQQQQHHSRGGCKCNKCVSAEEVIEIE
jgi:hypothetical protein